MSGDTTVISDDDIRHWANQAIRNMPDRDPYDALPACRCGHPADVHDHYRDGTDCGPCGRDTCPAYRATGLSHRTVWTLLIAACILFWAVLATILIHTT